MKGLLVKAKIKLARLAFLKMELVLLVILLGIVVRLGALVDCGCPMRCIWYGTEDYWKSEM